jgi:hypothetical protein
LFTLTTMPMGKAKPCDLEYWVKLASLSVCLLSESYYNCQPYPYCNSFFFVIADDFLIVGPA